MLGEFHIPVGDLKILAQEVCDLMKGLVGIEHFTPEYAKIHRVQSDKREERKRKRAAEVILTLCYSKQRFPFPININQSMLLEKNLQELHTYMQCSVY